jgi:uncharacterized repeat protein (TIGR03803 family)
MKYHRQIIFTVALIATFPTFAVGSFTLETLHSFAGGADGAVPDGTLLLHEGKLFGTTTAGGLSDAGTIYVVDPESGIETVVFAFSGSDGSFPNAALVFHRGSFYGTAAYGGTNNIGVVFKLNPDTAVQTVIYDFTSSVGEFPYSSLVSSCGDLYGTTGNGGDISQNGGYGLGAVFEVDEANDSVTLLEALELTTGIGPRGALVSEHDALYGTAADGGSTGGGTVFKIDSRTGVTSVVYNFGVGEDGAGPFAGVIVVDGKLYGTTVGGGTAGIGTVFKIDLATGSETVLHSFTGSEDGSFPYAKLLYHHGNLYGTTYGGGASNAGTVFRINPVSGAEEVLYSFSGPNDGANPYAGLVEYRGVLYGTATTGGVDGYGTIFVVFPERSAKDSESQ